MGNSQKIETLLEHAILDALQTVLGSRWQVSYMYTAGTDFASRTAAENHLVITDPAGVTFPLPVIYKAGYLTPQTLENFKKTVQLAEQGIILVADYFSPKTRQLMRDEGISGLDGSGWVSLDIFEPYPLVVRVDGSKRPPRQKGVQQKIQRLNGKSASRLMRQLLDSSIQLPLGVRSLALQAEVSPGTVSKILPTLEQEDALERNAQGAVKSINRWRLLERWAQDNKPFPTRAKSYIYPRDLGILREKIADYSVQETGLGILVEFLQQQGENPLLPVHAFYAYTSENIDLLAQELRLREAPAQRANVFLAPAPGELLEDFSLAQALVDTASLPGREKEVARQVIKATEGNRQNHEL